MTKNVLRSKKAASPLLVTIFLVALAVALGAMITSWGSTGTTRDSATCDDVKISPQIFMGDELFCYNETTGKVRFAIINDGDVSLSGVISRTVDPNKGVQDKMIPDSNLRRGEVLSTEVEIQQGRVRIELIPVIDVLRERLLCSGKAIIRENINKC